jgi:rifampicin phosphotransferase
MDWKFDDLASTTYPLYSRAIVGDLCPDPVTPLTATAGVAAELGPAWAAVYARTGLRPGGEDRPSPGGLPVAMFGAYLYLNTSLLRLFGVYASGADPEAFARQYLGERPDVPRQRDERAALPRTAARMRDWTGSVLARRDAADHTRVLRRVVESAAGLADPAGCSDVELAGRILGLRGELRAVLQAYGEAELATAVAAELLTRTADEAGQPDGTGLLTAGPGGLSGAVGAALRLAEQVEASGRLRRLFDRGPGEVGRLLAEDDPAAPPETGGEDEPAALSGDAGLLHAALAPLLHAHPQTGPAEWELSGPTWQTRPLLLVELVELLRRAAPEAEATRRSGERTERTEAAVRAVRGALRAAPAALARFDQALGATRYWLTARESIRRAASLLHHRQRQAARELGLRRVRDGLLDDVDQIFMLLADELPEFAADPSGLAESLRMRAYDYHALATYHPPFVTVGQPPPVVRWRRGELDPEPAARPEITGTAAAPGRADGAARVLRSATAPDGVRPGEVLVLPSGGPGWTVLLPLAAAVVVDGGGPLCPVAVACRELGVPCVVATVRAGTRIPAGAEVQVDGSAGVIRLPGHDDASGGPAPDTGPGPDGRVLPIVRATPTSNPA